MGVSSRAAETQDPSVEYEAFEIGENLEVNLFASEPMIANPIAMHFDPQGRLWVVCSPTYPHVVPGVEPNDYLTVLEDTDGDGKADKNTLFADKLYVPTGFALGDGGAYVANQPDLLFIKDEDGDGYGESRQVLLSGFGTEDNHHAISAWTWGPGGLLYFQSGIFLHTQVETPYGVTRLYNGGILQFHPRRLKLDIHVESGYFANPWGHTFDRWGQNFLTEAPGGHIYHLTPAMSNIATEGQYPRIEGAPKSCGIEFISGEAWPEDWQGDLILNAFKNRVVCRYKFSDDSSSFTAKEMDPLIVSQEENFRPVDVKQGPDGAIYILDWYNPIIGHMQYNFRDPKRDHSHGRVWRITHKGRDLHEPPVYEGKSPAEVLGYLKSDKNYNRNMARRVLYDRPIEEVLPALEDYLSSLDSSDPDYEHHRLEALWTYQTIDKVNPDLLKEVLESPEPRARAAAVRVLRHWIPFLENPLDLLEERISDEHPRARLETVVALSYIPQRRAAEIAARALDRPMDRYLDFALRHSLKALQEEWLPPLESGQVVFGGEAKYLAFALQAVKAEGAVKPLLGLVRSGDIAADRKASVVDLIGSLGNQEELSELLEAVVFPPAEKDEEPSPDDPLLAARALAALSQAAVDRQVTIDADPARLGTLFSHQHQPLAAEALRVAGAWNLTGLQKEIEDIAADGNTPPGLRQAAVEALGMMGGESSKESLRKLALEDSSPRLRQQAVAALTRVDLEEAAKLAMQVLQEIEAGNLATETLFSGFLSKTGGTESLAKAVTSTSPEKVSADTAKLALRHLYSIGLQNSDILAWMTSASGIAAGPREYTPEEKQALMNKVASSGNPHSGEEVFRRKDLACLSCHAVAGAGGQVGPDLAGIGVSSQLDYLVDAVLAPGSAVREGYVAQMVDTVDGESFLGTLARENENEIVLREQYTGEIAIAKEDIENRRDTGSLMPQGLVDLLTESELVDLVAFLAQLGRSGDFATPNVPVVRRWRVLENGDTSAPPIPGESLPGDLLDKESQRHIWGPVYSQVSGSLPVEDLPVLEGTETSLVSCQFEVTTPGKIEFTLNDTEGLAVWIDGHPMEVSTSLTADLERGVHNLLVSIDKKERAGADLRLEVHEVSGSEGRAFVLSGQ
jgi:putative heme-binding domain-containing protein